MKKSNASTFFTRKIDEGTKRYVDKNLDISLQVMAYLNEKGWSQSDFAKKMNKSDAEISRWLSGLHNLTLKSIAKMEAVLGEDIVITTNKAKEKYEKAPIIQWNVNIVNKNTPRIEVSNKHNLGAMAS